MKKNNGKVFSLLTHIVPKVFSVLIAILLFIVVNYFQMADRRVTIPLEVTLPSASYLVPESLVPDSVQIVISGSDALVYLVEPDKIKAYADFSDVREPGIARVPVTLIYDQEVFKKSQLVVSASRSVVRILFKEPK